jgi:hypothetical protein
MDHKALLVKAIVLLYRESQLPDKTENSADLVRTAIESVTVPEVGMGINTEREAISSLNPLDYEYDQATLLQSLKLSCNYDDKLYEVFEDSIAEAIPESQLKRTIVNLRKTINNHFKEQQINEVLNKASYEFRFKRDKIKDVNGFVSQVIAQLEPLQLNTSVKDPAVITDLDLGDDGAVREIFTEIQEIDNGDGMMKLGWQDVNDMTQGGFRRGEFIIVPGLQHKYKTGMSLSVFAHIAQYNVPYMIDPAKKPLLLRISFEDNLVSNLEFLYRKLKFDETGVDVEVKNISVDEMSSYIQQRLRVNGYHIKFMRVDPTQWTYKNICNKIIEYEAQGYEIHVCMVDYVGMLPTTGCNTTGPMGADKRDLIRRLRNFCAPKKITFITPYQLSTEAKQLIRNGLSEDQFVKMVEGKGYYDGCRSLDQEVDLELFIHLFKHNGEWFFSIQRGKHRLPTIVSEEKKYVLYKFPKKMPIKDDINLPERLGMRKLPSAPSNAEASLFEF